MSTMRLLEAMPDAQLVEVRQEQDLSGRFTREASDTGKSRLFFAPEEGARHLVANEPAGVSRWLGVAMLTAFHLDLSPLIKGSCVHYLWIICPCSAKDLIEWCGRSHSGTAFDWR